MQAAANRRPPGVPSSEEAAARRPLRRRRRHCLAAPAAIIVMYLVCVCLHGDANLQAAAAAVPAPRRRGPRLLAAAGSRAVVGSRPVPDAVVGAGGLSPSAAAGARFGDDKRRIPSCPDALHNR
ncbi:hypothetical protein PVAP13_5KG111700 [Panicum virgatum]|uniref:Uncharacterized protein n=1 Tax=Panicum virgatum TaxID=38727 RepID=A0A8T0S9Q6_PANVG|nr:hypothetical protein PVAP13_5KG111700 [Panicum virgatum]